MNHRGKKHVEAEVNTMSSFSLSAARVLSHLPSKKKDKSLTVRNLSVRYIQIYCVIKHTHIDI